MTVTRQRQSAPKATSVIVSTVIAFGSVANAYATLVDLETTLGYSGITIVSTLNQPVSIKFVQSGSEVPIPASSSVSFDGFTHNGVIQIKYTGSAPGSGSLIVYNY